MLLRKSIYCVLFIFFCGTGFAQQTHFIYIQSESNSPFYVKLNDQFYNSSSSGYVIVPNLRDGVYKVKVGFPKGDGVLECFDCKVVKKDLGFVLKSFQKGWCLYNLQNSTITTAGSHDANAPATQTTTNTFSAMLSTAVDDPSLKQSPSNTTTVGIKTSSQKFVSYNSNCKEEASNDDFLKLRKKMAASQKDEEMISEAKRVFRHKCFTTDEIRNLSVLFLKDEGKYNFFDAAYPYISDGNFNTLQDQLTDNYFISRFRMLTMR
jgi:hypothetical protein